MNQKQTKVLVVDDEIITCDLLERFLKKEGCAADSVHDGVSALRKVEEGGLDLILLDVRMPGVSGIETLKRIKGMDEDLPVLMLTAVDDVETALTAVREGADDYLRKPVMLPEIKIAIDSALEKRRLVHENREYQKRLEEKVAAQTATLKEMNLSLNKACIQIVRALSEAIEAKDPYTQGHCRRVTQLSLNLGKQVGVSGPELDALEYGALLHDIGKIGVRDSVLAKPGKLTEDEYEHIKEHPVIGENIIADIDFLDVARKVIRNHHERNDGNGYPDRLKDKDIPRLAKIIAIADAFDAMTSARPHRKGMSAEHALKILKANAGTQFDKELVDVFIGKKVYLLGA